ncbi:unnamed protein product [Meloidogyne enterolobii]|uniref:Uncharacterized protein n=1 Tax=Meloidogyne enterolobii TaxID=390850 RepID=A0ACB0YJ79_MELEN
MFNILYTTKIILFLLILFYFINNSFAVRTQSVAVKGKLLCGQAPARNVRVKLFDEDSGPDPDDLLEAGYSDASGNFQLKGSTVETTNIDVVLKVYHDCDDGIKPGSRKIKFKIPNSYVTEGQNPKKVFDIGTLNLETVFASEERELIVNKKRRNILFNWENELIDDIIF